MFNRLKQVLLTAESFELVTLVFSILVAFFCALTGSYLLWAFNTICAIYIFYSINKRLS